MGWKRFYRLIPMKLVQNYIFAALCLLLVLTGQSMAMMRGAAAPVGQMEICAGDTVVTVYIDAEGVPTAAPHVCPDCIMVLGQSPLQAMAVAIGTLAHLEPFDRLHVRPHGNAVETGFHSRAPPV